MLRLPSRLRRLDEILAGLPVEEPMLLSELDGYLTAIVVGPEPILPAEWLPPIWGGALGESAPFEDPIDVQMFADMVIARRDEIMRDLRRAKLQPIFDIDERHREVLWEIWIEGFEVAMRLRPESWSALAEGEDTEAALAVGAVLMLRDVASNASSLTSTEVNAICDEAPELIPTLMARLYARHAGMAPATVTRTEKTGRNEPCPCGSGKKYKRCCGMN